MRVLKDDARLTVLNWGESAAFNRTPRNETIVRGSGLEQTEVMYKSVSAGAV